jgi:hypothetical protein
MIKGPILVSEGRADRLEHQADRERITQMSNKLETVRIHVPAYTDAWMKGDRYGDLVRLARSRAHEGGIAVVRLDKSGKTLRFPLVHCTIY